MFVTPQGVGRVARGPIVDHSGAVSQGNVSQLVMDRNPERQFLLVQNTSSGDMWLGIGQNAQAGSPSVKLAAGQGLLFDQFVPTDAVYVLSATAGATFTAWEG